MTSEEHQIYHKDATESSKGDTAKFTVEAIIGVDQVDHGIDWFG